MIITYSLQSWLTLCLHFPTFHLNFGWLLIKFILCTGWTTLFLAAHKSNVEVAKLLCDSQANVDLKCEDGKTAISVAVQTGKYSNNSLLFYRLHWSRNLDSICVKHIARAALKRPAQHIEVPFLESNHTILAYNSQTFELSSFVTMLAFQKISI